jgi:hypothetical protein
LGFPVNCSIVRGLYSRLCFNIGLYRLKLFASDRIFIVKREDAKVG